MSFLALLFQVSRTHCRPAVNLWPTATARIRLIKADFDARHVDFDQDARTRIGLLPAADPGRIEALIKQSFEVALEIIVLERGAIAAEFENTIKPVRFPDKR
jgi:hypothetical protein